MGANPVTDVLIGRKFGDRFSGGIPRDDWMQRRGWCSHKPRNVEDSWQPPEDERQAWNGLPHKASRSAREDSYLML